MKTNVLIVGANFKNKGAQSMLYITVDEIKKRIDNCNIYFATTESINEQEFVFKKVFFSSAAKKIALRNLFPLFTIIKCAVKDCIKWTIGRHNNLWKFMEVRNLMPQIDLMIDVSGFNLGDKWSVKIQESYLDNIRLAKKYHIPMYMMPQSFGPFNYSAEQMYLKEQIQELLGYPEVVFAREEEGFKALKENFQLENVVLSTDLVLQNTGIDYNNIFCRDIEVKVPMIDKGNAVGIVPNMQCFRHGDEEKNIKLYKEIISELIDRNMDIYIFRHSKEDLEICEAIGACFEGEESVHLLKNDFSCIEYDQFVKNFKFIICSRYHGIVHAYRNYIPCIALGWAVKYNELAQNVNQAECAFDITDCSCTSDAIIHVMTNLMEHIPEAKEKIKERVISIQRNDCFSCISEWAGKNE